MSYTPPTPGSTEAIHRGCTCPIRDNDGSAPLIFAEGCPLHTPPTTDGIWVAFSRDMGFSDFAVFPDEVSARRYAMDNYMTVICLEYGKSLAEATR